MQELFRTTNIASVSEIFCIEKYPLMSGKSIYGAKELRRMYAKRHTFITL